MSVLIIGAILTLLFFVLLNAFQKASPATLANILSKVAGSLAIVVGLFLSLRGLFWLGLPLAIWGYLFIRTKGQYRFSIPGMGDFGSAKKSPGHVSSVRTDYLEMRLHHDSNHIDGRVLQGLFAGRALSSLSLENILQLYKSYISQDPQTADLLQAYLDRRYPDWQSHPDASGSSDDAGARRNGRGTGSMSEEEAYAVLGLKPGATEEDIRGAHRKLMKKFHPDQGGSTYLASKINEAKDLLLKRKNK